MMPEMKTRSGKSGRTLAATLIAGLLFGGGSIPGSPGQESRSIHEAAARVDVAFLPSVLIENPIGPDFIRDVFRPGIVVLTHYPESQAASLREIIRRIGDRLPPVIVFEKTLESRRIDPIASRPHSSGRTPSGDPTGSPAGGGPRENAEATKTANLRPAARSDLPSRFDWREEKIMTPVKHQGDLGSCGVFAAVAVFESLIKKATGETVDLSEQQIINGSLDFAPSGISSVDAMKYIKRNGLVREERFPYRDKKTGDLPAGPPDYKLTDYQYVYTNAMSLADKIRTIKQAVREHGPVATNMIFFKDLDRYRGGVYVHDGLSEEQGGHWVVVIGWRDDANVKNGGYWICRNSWGETWGENGYFHIAYGECGIDDFWFVYGILIPQLTVHQ